MITNRGVSVFSTMAPFGRTSRSRMRSPMWVGSVKKTRVHPRYFRPTEVEPLLGDPRKAKAKLGWTPATGFEELVREMVDCDYSTAKRDSMVKLAGFRADDNHE